MADLDEKSVMLGQHEARLDGLEKTTAEIRDDVKKLLAFMESGKGSWKTLVVIGTAASALIEGVHQLWGWFHK